VARRTLIAARGRRRGHIPSRDANTDSSSLKIRNQVTKSTSSCLKISNNLTDNALASARFIKLASNAKMQPLMTPATMVHF
jgi:hypothetical protein